MLTINFSDFPLSDGDVVLDVGCGEGRHVIHAHLQANLVAIGVDLSFRDLSIAQEKFAPFADLGVHEQPCAGFVRQFILQQADATRLPFADSTIDKIICSEVLEHIEHYESVLREIDRVLKPKGILAVSVPRAWPEKICWWLSDAYHQNEGGHLRIFNERELRARIESLDFVFTKRHWAHALHVPFWWLKCLWWKSQDKSCIIRAYHRLLVWDLMSRPWLTQTIEKCLNPIMGKSVVLYFKKSEKLAQRKPQ